MAKYRKKPIIIEAEQWFKGSGVDGVFENCLDDDLVTLSECSGVVCTNCKYLNPYIRTLEGPMQVSEGDYIITDAEGEKYACKPDIFAKTYKLVEE